MPRVVCLCLLLLTVVTVSFAKDRYQKPGPVHPDRSGEKWAERTLRKLSTEEKVGQLFMIWARAQYLSSDSPDYLELRDTMNKYHVGSFAMSVPVDGPLLFKSEPYEAAVLLNRLQQDSKLPLLFAADFERGLSMRLSGPTVFPHAMAFGAAGQPELAQAFGRITAEESRAIGIHWNFFPVADVNSNPANPIINTRSFGEDPRQVGTLVAAYVRGAHAGGMLTTAKHFPGHGDTATDSHLGLAKVGVDLVHLNSIELPPFQQAIAAGVDSIMVAHVTVPALDPDPDRVASTSFAVVTDLLEKQMKFTGIVTTDALDMAGLTRLYSTNVGRAAVEAFKAGNDVLLIPADLDASYNSLLAAVRGGEISSARLDESVLKILKAKASLGLHRARLVDVNAIAREVGTPQNAAAGQRVADAALTLVRDNRKLLPLKASGTNKTGLPYMSSEETHNHVVAVIFSDDVRTESGRMFARQLRSRVPDANILYVDPRIAAGMSQEVLQAVSQAQVVIAAVYIVPTAGKVASKQGGLQNSVALSDATGSLLQKLLENAGDRTAVVAMGSPYLAADFPGIQNYLCTFSNATVSELSAVKALFGEIAIAGHLPVSIPNVAERGAGLERPAQVAGGGGEHGQSRTSGQ
ncbi:MAG TPA: glycoside hydrolase family 3 N-terminal domain-containing protein [Terriglobales bacterium]|nr:glycoside hydrolase family 3 N-terminal domain-containing protein [Terriglobales bacterium]